MRRRYDRACRRVSSPVLLFMLLLLSVRWPRFGIQCSGSAAHSGTHPESAAQRLLGRFPAATASPSQSQECDATQAQLLFLCPLLYASHSL